VSGPGGSTDLRTWDVIRLVAWREMLVRFRSKAYRIATGLMIAGVVAISVLPSFAGSADVRRVAVLSGDESLPRLVTEAAQAVGEPVRVAVVTDPAEAQARLLDGRIDVLVQPQTGGRLGVTVVSGLDVALRGALETVARQAALRAQIEAAGVDPGRIDAAVAAAGLDVATLKPAREYDPERIGLGMVAGIAVYVALVLYGQQVAQGVVEEKSSRIVELLLTTIRPWQLMVGKVAGIGLVGLMQMGVTTMVGFALGSGTGSIDIDVSVAAGTAAWTLVWFVLGFVAYALLFAAVGALVSRQEEVGGVSSPVLIVIIVPYIVGVSVLPGDPGNSLVATLSMIPIFSPTLMPMRVALGAPGWQLAVSVGAMLVLIAGLVWLAGRIYGNAVLRTGTRVRLRDALRKA
jgi:ABC-2 type transport system permease protein